MDFNKIFDKRVFVWWHSFNLKLNVFNNQVLTFSINFLILIY